MIGGIDLKKFFLALFAFALIVAAEHSVYAAAAAQITKDQFEHMAANTLQSAAASADATLNIDAATFQRNFDAFVKNFIGETNANAQDAAHMAQIFTLNDAKTFDVEGKQLFAKNFLNRVMIIGVKDAGGNFKVLNFFAAQAEERDDALFDVLVLQAFVKGITPDFDAMDLLRTAKNDPDGAAIHNGVRFSVFNADNLNIVSATVAE